MTDCDGLRTHSCERCNKRVPCLDLEAIFLEQMKGLFSNPKRVGVRVAEATEKARTNEALIGAVTSEITKMKEHMAKTHQLYLAGAASVERFKELNDPLEERLLQLQAERTRLQATVDVARAETLSASAVIEESTDLHKRWPTFDSDRKRNVVQSLVKSLTVDVDARRMRIIFNDLPSVEEETTNNQQAL